jgi:hypothetical protein
MKKKSAVFTIVKNEDYFLPIWIKHYKKYFDESDIYILDHQSDNGSTNNLTVNVIPVINELAFDHQWLVDTVQNFQKELLEKYECVVFAESDELLYSIEKPLNLVIEDLINNSNQDYITCIGHEVIEMRDEKSLTFKDEIFKNRNYWFKTYNYDKTLISKIPLNWCWGFHNTNGKEKEFTHGVHMVHLHRVDFEMMLKRHQERATKWKLKNDGPGVGFQHKIGDREGVMEYFKDIPSKPTLIPNEHKIILKGI